MTRHLTFANIASALALVVALSTGSAYAASHLPKNSVASKQVKDHSLMAKDFKAGQLPAGPAGPTGPTGPTGPAGAPAVTLFAAVVDSADASDTATLGVTKGGVSVADPAGANNFTTPYLVTFNRDLSGCVVTATVGRVDSHGSGVIRTIYAEIVDSTVKAFSATDTGAYADGSFMVAVYC